jgi:hypothetical protein
MTIPRPLVTALLALVALPLTAPAPAELRSYDRVLLLESVSETSASVSLGDIDGNGTLDVVLAKGRHWPLNDLILRNDGHGKFTTELLADAPDRTYSAALADLDGDGALDIVVSNDRPDKKLVYKNDGKGHFTVIGTFGQPEWSTRYVTVADLNGDKRPDLIVANRSSNPNAPKPSYVCLNDGKGGFPTCEPLATQSATIIVAADFDGDGKIDLFVPHRDGGQSLIFWNDGSGHFTAAPATFGGPVSNARAAAAGDVNGDGILDLVVGDEKAGLFIYYGEGKRAFGAALPLGPRGSAPYSIAIADMNKDGLRDIVVGNQEAPGVVFFNQGGKTPTFNTVTWGDGKGSVYGLAVGDLDGDGWPDIAGARSEAQNGIWFSGAIKKP